MNQIKTLFFSFIIGLTLVTSVGAQKFGHLNSRILLMEMEEIKQADNILKDYEKTLIEKGQNMVTAFEADYNKYAAEYQQGTLSSLQAQTREGELNNKREEIQGYQVEVQNLLGSKKEELYAPLLEKVKNAIDKIGKDNGYTIIFDTSVAGAIVHAQESEDIIEMVKAALGLPLTK